MESNKKRIRVNVSGSGYNGLSVAGNVLRVIYILSLITAIMGIFMYFANRKNSYDQDLAAVGISIATSAVTLFIISLFGSAVCAGLASIVKSSLYKWSVLEQEYEFKTVYDDDEDKAEKQ